MGYIPELRERIHREDDTTARKCTKGNSEKPKLLKVTEIPDWYQNNDFITNGYRPVSGSLISSFESLSYIHNETANIFSHLMPAVAILLAQGFLWNTFWIRFPEASYHDYSIFAFHTLTATCCFGLSATYHTLINHSERILGIWSRVDYVGIIALIIGDFVSGIYVAFYCEPHLRLRYWTMILVFGALTGLLVTHPAYQTRRYRLVRLTAFVTTGLSAFAPIIHAVKLFDHEQLFQQTGLPYYYMEGVLCILGAFFYATHLPERLLPEKFDIWAHSHLIFHCLVVMSAVVHFQGIWTALEWHYDQKRCLGDVLI